jgi:hypothetical protein
MKFTKLQLPIFVRFEDIYILYFIQYFYRLLISRSCIINFVRILQDMY